MSKFKVAIIMGSQSDWPIMRHAASVLEQFDIPFESMVVSAHRTPQRLYEFAHSAEENYGVVIAGAGGAAHLPGMAAAMTCVPVIGVPVKSNALKGMDSLLSIVQMPKGVAVATQAIGEAGAFNAGLLAAQMLSIQNPELQAKVKAWRSKQTESVSWEVE